MDLRSEKKRHIIHQKTYIWLKTTDNEETGAAGISLTAGEEINTVESSNRKTRVEIIYAVMFVTLHEAFHWCMSS